jgi:lauroyl/myristoyl acyltransferase
VRKVFHGIIDHYHEKLFVAYVYFPRLIKFLKTRIVMAGEPILRQALEAGKGVILVTGHYGGVELLPGFLAVAGFPVTMICRFQTSRLRQSMEQRAGWVGLSLIDADSPNIFFKAVQALKQGHILITECDEFEAWRPDSQGRLNFLQAELPQDRTLELFQRRAGAPVVCALLRREGGRRYTLQFASVALQPGQGRRPLSQQCLEVLEEAILSQPAQWYQWKKFAQFCYANGVSHPGIS